MPQYMFKAQTVEELKAELVRFLRFRAEQETSQAKLYVPLTLKNICIARGKTLAEVADEIEQADLVKTLSEKSVDNSTKQ